MNASLPQSARHGKQTGDSPWRADGPAMAQLHLRGDCRLSETSSRYIANSADGGYARKLFQGLWGVAKW
jgi:hypothetical protein